MAKNSALYVAKKCVLLVAKNSVLYITIYRYIVGEFLHDLMFSDDFYDDRKEKGVSYKVVMAFREKMKPYIEKLPELEAVMEEVIEFEVNN